MTRILIIDDDPNIRYLIDTVLTTEGYKAVTAASGDEAVSHASKQPFDLALIDLIMPGKDGIETMLLLRARQPQLRIIAMSGGWSGGTRTCLPLAGKLGACATLAKPFDRAALLEAVRREVGEPEHEAGRRTAVSGDFRNPDLRAIG